MVMGDRRVEMMEESMKRSGEEEMNFRFVRVEEGTIRACCDYLQQWASSGEVIKPHKVVLVCGIEDVMSYEYTEVGKRIILQHPQKNEFEQAMRLQKHVTLFEKKIKDLWSDVQTVWVVPHPVDVETHLRLNLKRTGQKLPKEYILQARFLTRLLNGTFQKWESYLRQDVSRMVLPWFLKFVGVVPDGSKRFVTFMKAIRVGGRSPSIKIEPLLPEAIPDGFYPSHDLIMKVLKALKGVSLTRTPGTIVQCSITEQEVIISRTRTVQAINVTDGNVYGTEFNIESERRTSAVPEIEQSIISDLDESYGDVVSDVAESTVVETPLIIDHMINAESEETEITSSALPASTCSPPEVCSAVGTKKKIVSMVTDLSSLLTDVTIAGNQTINKDVSIDTQDDLVPELMVLPCGHLHCHEGARPSSVRCGCGKLFDLVLCDEAVIYAKVVKYTL